MSSNYTNVYTDSDANIVADETVTILTIHDDDTVPCNNDNSNCEYVFTRLNDFRNSMLYCRSEQVEERCTLRIMNRLYARSGGRSTTKAYPEEFDCIEVKDNVAPMKLFTNIYGHISDNKAMVFKPQMFGSVGEMLMTVAEKLRMSVMMGNLWVILDTAYLCVIRNKWMIESVEVDPIISKFLNLISTATTAPISAHSYNAHKESTQTSTGDKCRYIFSEPLLTTRTTGLIGTLNNNQQIDSSPYETSAVPDINARSHRIEYNGFLCSGHTAHSSEAMRARKVVDKLRIRILNKVLVSNIIALAMAIKSNSFDYAVTTVPSDWIIFCMGYMSKATIDEIKQIYMMALSQSGEISHHYTVHIYDIYKVVVISVSSGVMLKKSSEGYTCDSVMIHNKSLPDDFPNTTLKDPKGPGSNSEYLSTFYTLVPFVRWDRPPRTVMSSMQSIQSVCSPWGVGSSAYTPTYSSVPVVITDELFSIITGERYIDGIHKYTDLTHKIDPTTLPPGYNLMVLIMNDTGTYEDAALMSRCAADRGMFSTVCETSMQLLESDNIPKLNEIVSYKTHDWWKNRSTSVNRSGQDLGALADLDTVGRIVYRSEAVMGRVSVRVRSTTKIQTGDKITTWHGQKYTVLLKHSCDMPTFEYEGEMYTPDIVVSLTSLLNRLTNGAYMDMAMAVKGVEKGKPVIVKDDIAILKDLVSTYYNDNAKFNNDGDIDLSIIMNEVNVYNGETGHIYESDTSSDGCLYATFGIAHVVEQTQKTRDKMHYTHELVGSDALKARQGRSIGGAVNLDEMSA